MIEHQICVLRRDNTIRHVLKSVIIQVEHHRFRCFLGSHCSQRRCDIATTIHKFLYFLLSLIIYFYLTTFMTICRIVAEIQIAELLNLGDNFIVQFLFTFSYEVERLWKISGLSFITAVDQIMLKSMETQNEHR